MQRGSCGRGMLRGSWSCNLYNIIYHYPLDSFESSHWLLSSFPSSRPLPSHALPSYTVSLVGTAIKELGRPKSSRLVRKYLFKVERILKGQLGSMSLSAQDQQSLIIRVILLQSKMEISATKHLQEGAKYILRGRMVCGNMLYILGSHSRHYYIF